GCANISADLGWIGVRSAINAARIPLYADPEEETLVRLVTCPGPPRRDIERPQQLILFSETGTHSRRHENDERERDGLWNRQSGNIRGHRISRARLYSRVTRICRRSVLRISAASRLSMKKRSMVPIAASSSMKAAICMRRAAAMSSI